MYERIEQPEKQPIGKLWLKYANKYKILMPRRNPDTAKVLENPK